MKLFEDNYKPPNFCKSGEYTVNKTYNSISVQAFNSIKDLNYRRIRYWLWWR